jgi:Putative adhesin
MPTITAPSPAKGGRTEGARARGRWIWAVSGLATITVLAVSGTHLITTAGAPAGGPQQESAVPSRSITITQPVTSLNIESYGAPIVVTGGPVKHVQVSETITFATMDGPPVVTQSVSHGLLTLTAPGCAGSPCSVGFTVTVPKDVAVTAQSDDGPLTVSGVAAANLDSGGGPARVSDVSGQLTVSTEDGPLIVSGVADANLDSGGGPVQVRDVRGPLTVNTENGNLVVTGLTGPLDADTGGGALLARDVAAVTATVSTEGGNADIAFTNGPQLVSVDSGGGTARVAFAGAPQSVSITAEGGDALLTVPGGPYAVTAQSEGGPQYVDISANPTAHRSITVDSGGGLLSIQSGTGPGTQPGGKLPHQPKNPATSSKPTGPSKP